MHTLPVAAPAGFTGSRKLGAAMGVAAVDLAPKPESTYRFWGAVLLCPKDGGAATAASAGPDRLSQSAAQQQSDCESMRIGMTMMPKLYCYHGSSGELGVRCH